MRPTAELDSPVLCYNRGIGAAILVPGPVRTSVCEHELRNYDRTRLVGQHRGAFVRSQPHCYVLFREPCHFVAR